MSNLLKRKNEDAESPTANETKRVALDSEQLELNEKQEHSAQTAPVIGPSNKNDSEPEISQATIDSPPKIETTEDDSHESSYSEKPQEPESYSTAKPVVAPRLDDEETNLSIRMLCPTKEAGIIVGKKGDTITHIRQKANVRVYVSENLKNVPERVISVRGSSENVARAFGLITRTILEEPEDEPALITSKLYIMKLLIPHAIVGYVIGKGGSKFREIEENSAARLKAQEQPLPYSTDRILLVTGVADAIHIAIYYISQVLLEHRDALKKHKVVFYNPANFRPPPPGANPMMNMHMPQQSNMPYMAPGPDGYGQGAKPYDFLMMFQPAIRPQYNTPQNIVPPPHQMPPQSSYTDEHGNTIVGDVITQMPVQVSSTPERYTQDIFVANVNIGSVIGKGGNNIKQIRESSGCSYVKIEPDMNQSILLGGGKGLTSVRKLTLTGNYNSIQSAIFLVNQRISADKERNGIQ